MAEIRYDGSLGEQTERQLKQFEPALNNFKRLSDLPFIWLHAYDERQRDWIGLMSPNGQYWFSIPLKELDTLTADQLQREMKDSELTGKRTLGSPFAEPSR